ncbi:BPG2, partial [Symbiodinium microadriaticum]
VDLLPKDASLNRVNDWVHSLVRKKCDLLSPRETDELDSKLYAEKGWYPSRKNSEAGILRRGNVHLVSCDKGTGLPELLTSVVGMAKENGDKVYVMGTANVGKSSFINRLLRYSKKQKGTTMQSRKKLAVPQATVSSLPGTTLDFLKIKLPNGLTVIDTPGLINPGQITTKLNSTELKKVIPSKRVSHVTLRIDEGRCVLIGALAKFELVQGRPVQCTFFISNEVKLHPTSSERADEILTQHDGQLVFPPASKQRLTELGPWEYTMLNVTGQGWKKATCDIAIGGLGFVSVTGPGMFQIKVSVPKGTSVTVRDPMLPFEASKTSVRHTGTRFIRKCGGIGWRV